MWLLLWNVSRFDKPALSSECSVSWNLHPQCESKAFEFIKKKILPRFAAAVFSGGGGGDGGGGCVCKAQMIHPNSSQLSHHHVMITVHTKIKRDSTFRDSRFNSVTSNKWELGPFKTLNHEYIVLIRWQLQSGIYRRNTEGHGCRLGRSRTERKSYFPSQYRRLFWFSRANLDPRALTSFYRYTYIVVRVWNTWSDHRPDKHGVLCLCY